MEDFAQALYLNQIVHLIKLLFEIRNLIIAQVFGLINAVASELNLRNQIFMIRNTRYKQDSCLLSYAILFLYIVR